MMRFERRLPALGGIAFLLLLALGYQMSGDPAVPGQLDMPVTPAPEPSPPPAPAPAPPAAPPPAAPDGLRLHGVTGAGAIIAAADGRQRLVAIGRDVLPGLRLEQVHLDHALLRSSTGAFRLDFTGAPAVAAPGSQASASSDDARDESLRYRLGLAPHRVGGRVVGHQVRTGADLPALARAGIQPGDVILSVNGSRLDRERVAELAWTLAHSDRVEFEIERSGQPRTLSGAR